MHLPVFLNEVLEIFDPKPGQTYIDATVNGGGHARAIADRVGEAGRVIGIDLDAGLIERLRARNKRERRKNIELVHGNYKNLGAITERLGYQGKIDGVLFDLGFSSYHVDQAGRGFSFRSDEPLDMRYDSTGNAHTAADIINTWSAKAIENLLREYGEERYSRRIANRIVAERGRKRITAAARLAEIVCTSIPAGRRLTRMHPATRTFQALRMAVNDELGNLERGLEAAAKTVGPGGTIIAISFHSLEDRIIKRFFHTRQKEGMVEVRTPKPLTPSTKEVTANPRARSAKLRAARKII